jgi:hypothetical protein
VQHKLNTLRTADVEVELEDIKDAAVAAHSMKFNPWRAIISRKFMPQLVTIVALQIFNQLDGINSIMFYAPQVCTPNPYVHTFYAFICVWGADEGHAQCLACMYV